MDPSNTAHNLEMRHAREEYRQNLKMLQHSWDNLAEEYEDLYDAHQLLSITLQDAEKRQDEDARMMLARNKRCSQLEATEVQHLTRIQEMEAVLAGVASASVVENADRASILWWKDRCRSERLINHALERRVAVLSEEACPMMCERLFTHSMACCGSKICHTCLSTWKAEKTTCPYCRSSPLNATVVDRLGTVRNPIELV